LGSGGVSKEFFDPPRDERTPAERVQAHTKRVLPKRFYEEAGLIEEEGGHAVVLDGRPVRTPAGNKVIVSDAAVAAALTAEWQAQESTIDPATMPLSRLVNSALDGVAGEMAAVRGEIVSYAGNDLVLYRAETPEGLVARQQQAWDPIVAWAEARFGGRFILAQGVMHVAQSAPLLAAIGARLEPAEALPLAALNVVTTLTGSALIALALWDGALDAETAWAAAHVDEDWNMELWGKDVEALARREGRRAEFSAAILILEAMRSGEAGR